MLGSIVALGPNVKSGQAGNVGGKRVRAMRPQSAPGPTLGARTPVREETAGCWACAFASIVLAANVGRGIATVVLLLTRSA